MPTYEITKDGATYQVDAPDENAALSALSGQASSEPPPEAAPTKPAATSSLKDEIAHQLGLTARWGIKGVTALPEIVGNAANAAVNLGSDALNWANRNGVTRFGKMGTVSDSIDRGMDAVGIPQPRNGMEQLIGVGAQALTGAGAAREASQLIPRVAMEAPTIAEQVLSELGKGPALQTVGAASGYLTSEAAKRMGVTNPAALGVIGMVGGMGAGGGITALERGATGTAAAVKPFLRAGKEQLVGEALNAQATNPTLAADTLENAAEIIPGSRPTVSQASRDPGLIRSESAVRGFDQKGAIEARNAEQNAARQRALYSVAGDEGTLNLAKAAQKAAYDTYAKPAFANSTPINIGRTIDDNPVLETIAMIRKSPEGARKTVRDAMDHAEEQLTQPDADITDAETLYNIRKDLALARDGKLLGKGKDGIELANLKNARSQLGTVIDSLDNVIETGAPGFRDYLKAFHELSLTVDQLKSLQRLRSQAELAVSDPVTQLPVLGNKFQTLLKNNLDNGLNLRGTGPKAGNLTPSQLETLSRIAADMDRSAAAQAGTMKVAGSDTFKNLSVASVIGRVLGDNTGGKFMESAAGRTVARPLAFLYRIPEEDIQHLMLQAWLDPKLAARLMKQATRGNIEDVADALKRRASDNAIGSAVYSNK